MTRLQRLRRHLAGDAAAMGIDEQRPLSADDSDRLGGPVAVIIAIATLLAAVVAFQQADTSELADDQRLAATSLGLQAAASAQREQQQAQVEYVVYQRSVEQQAQAGNATLRWLYAETDSAEALRFELERERWQELADATAAASEIRPDSEFGPERDPTFPRRYFAAAAHESHRLNALQDAYNEQASLLDQRAASYTAILAVLAVAVYLLGLTLAVREYLLRRVFLAVGVALMLVAGGWAVLTAGQAVAPINDAAAAAYASARVELDTASAQAGYAEAERLYDEAIALRPTFARAYLERASATIFAATPQQTGLVSLVPPEALRAGQADLRRALELGAATASVHGRLGFYDFLGGVQTGERRPLEDSVASSRRAIELDPAEPVWRFNLAVALVALDRFDEAEVAYRAAVEAALYIDADPARLRDEAWQEEIWLAGALTDLEVVGRERLDLADRVRAFKEWLVGRIAARALEEPPASTVTAGELALDVFASKVQWQAELAAYDPARDVVSVQWYRAAGGTNEWAVIPELSNSSPPFLGADGRYGLRTFYLGAFSPPTCLPAGTYRAELYVNGRLLTTAEAPSAFSGLDAAAHRDITLAFCRPPEWQPIEDALPGLVQGYTAADEQRGIYAMRLGLPRSFLTAEGLTELIIDTAIASFADRFPGTPVYLEDEGTTAHDFVALDRPAWRWYDYGSGYVRVAAGLTQDGAAVLAMAFGSYSWFDTDEPYDILNSMVAIE